MELVYCKNCFYFEITFFRLFRITANQTERPEQRSVIKVLLAERTHHYWFLWKRCHCKQYFLLPTPSENFTLFIVNFINMLYHWYWVIFIYEYSKLYIYIYIYIYINLFLIVSKFCKIWEVIIFSNPSTQAGYDTRSIFKQSLTGLNSEFSFS